MKTLVTLVVVLIVAAAAAWYWFNGSISHRDIRSTVCDESAAVQEHVEKRYRDLDNKLDRIEGKLDRLLKLADRPLPDGMQKSE